MPRLDLAARPHRSLPARIFHSLLCGMALLLAAVPMAGAEETPAQPAIPEGERIEFSRDIRPILSDTCFACHGPDAKARKAELRLDTQEGLFQKKDDIANVIAGNPEESELYLRITAEDAESRMPPASHHKQLTPVQIERIKKWIEQGAEWQGHWAYVAPGKPVPPTVDDPAFVRNEIDPFILLKLKEVGLTHAPEADRTTLIRRLSFDLTGLPPSAAEVEAFLADEQPDAYERVVDRLLASPHFGERMAVAWLDLVRYADTTGIHGDNHRDIYPYRDYVIQAFNENLPFDQFTREQLAGDLLPEPTTRQLIASGYNRLLMTTAEGGAQPKEYLAKYSADRVRNVSSVWMAGTLGCAECHDHKYDPFTAKDFYSMAAFFADIQDVAVGMPVQTPVPTAEQQAEMTSLDEQLAAALRDLNAETPERTEALARWEAEVKNREVSWTVLEFQEAKSAGGATLEKQDDGAYLAKGENPATDTYTLTGVTKLSGITAIRLESLADETLPTKGPGRAANGNFVLTELQLAVNGKPVAWGPPTASHVQEGFEATYATDGDTTSKKGWAILPQVSKDNRAVFEIKDEVPAAEETTLTFTLHQNYGGQHALGRFRVAVTTAARPVRVDGNGLPKNITDILAVAPAERTDRMRRDLAGAFRQAAPEFAPQRAKIAELQAKKAAILAAAPKTLITTTGAPRPIRVLPRGNWLDETGEVVAPAVPGFLPSVAGTEARPSRLDLANWILDPKNPTTSRVMVNRLWKIAFGQGIVKSLDDFGSQGAPPSHPRLLDWLATDFVEHGWDVKRSLKQMLMSGTYRQSSYANAELQQRDPYNRWLARQGRFRLEAESIRDNALAVSGLLVAKVGGPSAKPYQPAGYWDHLNFPKRTYDNDKGEGLYRRGLYTYWCRTFLHPSMLAFDASTREECTVDRPRSNTPLQALVLLNDPTYVEAARAFAERILREGGETDAARLEFAFRSALSRSPRAQESGVLLPLLEKHRQEYTAAPEDAQKAITVGDKPADPKLPLPELAAWTSVARVILNLHETMTRN